ncbi:MAG: hypothetical protein QXO84_03275 [Candidatus Aenigmatarchaeota archaeon]
MNKAQKIVAIFLLITFITISALYVIYLNKKQKSTDDGILFFYSTTCPHCKNVEDFIQENNLESKIKIIKKEVNYNQKNFLELTQYAKSCGVNYIGVPFVYYKGKCYVGETEIINLLKNVTGV